MRTLQNSMKPTATSINPRHRRERLFRGNGTDDGIATRSVRNRIQWPTPQELQQVSTTLTKVSRWGRRREAAGDYFNSGDLAYQLQEIIRTTNALLKKSQRPRTPNPD